LLTAKQLANESKTQYYATKEVSTTTSNKHAFWIISNIGEDFEESGNHSLMSPRIPYSECADCKAKKQYKTEDAATVHLQSIHFPTEKGEDDELVLKNRFHHLVKCFDLPCDKKRYQEHMKVFKRCSEHLDRIRKHCHDIRDGVLTNDSSHQSRYRLPKAFLEAFGGLVMLLIYTSHVLEVMNANVKEWTRVDLSHDATWSTYQQTVEHINRIGAKTATALAKSKLDLVLMLRTQDYTRIIRHEVIGPQYILGMILNNLQPGVHCKNLVTVYKDYIARLVGIKHSRLHSTETDAPTGISSYSISTQASPPRLQVSPRRTSNH
jgi:hypothetical protein